LLNLAQQKFVEDSQRIEAVQAEVLDRQTELVVMAFMSCRRQRGIQNERRGIATVEFARAWPAKRVVLPRRLRREFCTSLCARGCRKAVIEGSRCFAL